MSGHRHLVEKESYDRVREEWQRMKFLCWSVILMSHLVNRTHWVNELQVWCTAPNMHKLPLKKQRIEKSSTAGKRRRRRRERAINWKHDSELSNTAWMTSSEAEFSQTQMFLVWDKHLGFTLIRIRPPSAQKQQQSLLPSFQGITRCKNWET